MPRPIRCTVSIAALRHNYFVARSHAIATGHTGAWAVVKAAAYGHGMAPALAGFAAADGLALLDFADAQFYRAQGWPKPILMLEGPFDSADVALASELNLALVIHNEEQVQWLCGGQSTHQPNAMRALQVHLKINSGMNRLGFAPTDAPAMAQRLLQSPRVKNVQWMTHFANADAAGVNSFNTEPSAAAEIISAATQAQRFFAVAPADAIVSLANSAATLQKIRGSGWARPGIMLYGASPFAEQTAQHLQLQAAMALDSQIIAVQFLEPGDQVGYGSTFTATKAMRIGVVACGYADGYPRHAPNGTPVLVNGTRTQIVGRVSMDMLTVDLTNIEAQVGSAVQLWGAQLPIDEVASRAGTIGYELMCAVAARVPRVVIDPPLPWQK
jgi:alanine racemase